MQDNQRNTQQEIYISDAQKERWPKVDAALKRLCNNEDFKLVLDELTIHEPQRTAAMLGDDQFRQRPDRIELLKENLQAVGIFQSFLRDIGERGMIARQANMTPEELDELLDQEQAAYDNQD